MNLTPINQRVALLLGDVRDILRSLPDESVHCVVTSPPYWGLRDYGLPPSEWEDGWTGCLGLEPDPAQFICHMVEVFAEVRRVLRRDGVCFMNLGDSYAANGVSGLNTSAPSATFHGGTTEPRYRGAKRVPDGLKPKDLCLMPHRVAIALQEDGWWIRSTIVWSKANPMPESVTDRPTTAHEYVFLLTRSERYFWDADAVREPQESAARSKFYDIDAPRGKCPTWGIDGSQSLRDKGRPERLLNPAGRNMRSVLHIPTEPCPEAHFATYPRRLITPFIKAGTSERGCCPACGAPWRRQVEREREYTRPIPEAPKFAAGFSGEHRTKAGLVGRPIVTAAITTGWQPSCACGREDVEPCVVLDIFGGSGTTGLVAAELGRRAILIDLKREYLEIAARRLAKSEQKRFDTTLSLDLDE